MNKKNYFLCSLPRAGNTILGSLINQSKNVKLSSNSIIPEIIYRLLLLKDDQLFKNFPDHNSFDNIIKNIFDNYYKDWKAEYIITRGTWGTPANLNVLKAIIKQPKFIILYRPVLECVASFIQIEKPKDIESRCRELLSEDGIIGKSLISIKNIIAQEDYIKINYKDFVGHPQNEINKIFQYLKTGFFKIDLNNIKQFSVNEVYYDDTVLPFNLHTIKTEGIKVYENNIKEYLPLSIINEYKNIDI